MSNLIERLRDEPHWYSIRRHGLTTPECEVWHRTCCRAADEIERLLMLGKIQADRLNEALVEIERLTAQVATCQDANGRQYKIIKDLQARVDALEKVRKAVLTHRDNKEFLNIDTWNACVSCAQERPEQGESDA